MPSYKSSHTGTQIDSASSTVLDEDCRVKYGNFIGTISDQADLQAELNKLYAYKLVYTGSAIQLDGVTKTFAQIKGYFDEGARYIYLFYNDTVYLPASITASKIVFSNALTKSSTIGLVEVSITSSNSISVSSTLGEKQSNKTTSLSASSTDTQYPSAKAVYEAVAAISNTAGNNANTDLSNLTFYGGSRLHASKGYLEDGVPYVDNVLYEDVYKCAHSTFDSTKFTVVGSPTITSEGIASGFSGSNYLQNTTINFNSLNTTKIRGRFKTSILQSTDMSILNINGWDINFGCYNTSLYASLTNATVDSSITLENNTEYDYILDYTSNTITLSVKKVTSDNYIINTATVSYSFDSTGFVLGTGAGGTFTGSIDLKQFSITVNGSEVFSGHKTGIDTIKTDDYTVVGSPTITADGIASGFSNSNYIYGLVSISNNKRIVIKQKVQISNITSSIGILGVFTGSDYTQISSSFNFGLHTTSTSKLYLKYYNGSTEISNNTGLTVTANTEYNIRIEYNGVNELKVYANNILLTTVSNYSPLGAISFIKPGVFVNYLSSGSIDLNFLKIYVDGFLVYQPYIKIPYTESKTGSKIVDSYYKDVVLYTYRQFGSANYYTLQIENEPNFDTVGALTISNDYVVTGFSNSKYISAPFNIANKSWKMVFSYTLTGAIPDTGDNANPYMMWANQSNAMQITPTNTMLWVNGHMYNIAYNQVLTTGDVVDIVFEFNKDTSIATCTGYINGQTKLDWKKINTSASANSSNFNMSIGCRPEANTPYVTTCSVDLKKFKIYSGEDILYQAVIPPNATLPMGEIYGFIEQAKGSIGTSTVGGLTTPIFLNQGAPTACTYSLAKSVPSNAVFTDTTYANGTGISIGTGNAINHSNSVTAGTAGTSSATNGSTLAVPYVTYDAQGHVTASGTHTHTVTGFSTTDTLNTAGSTDTNNKIFLVGATSQAANPQTYSHDTVFVDTDGAANSVTPINGNSSTKVATTEFALKHVYGLDLQKITTVSGTTVTLGYDSSLYKVTISSTGTITFDCTGITLTDRAVTFEVWLVLSSVVSFSFSNTITWVEQPSFTTTGNYLMAFKSFDGGSTFLGNLEVKW